MTFLQDLSLFPDRRRGAHTKPKMSARTRSAAPGTKKAAQNPNAEASRPPPIGSRAKPVEVAEEPTPKAAPAVRVERPPLWPNWLRVLRSPRIGSL
jgi:hypothetical protein